MPAPPPLRDGFLSFAGARALLAGRPGWRDALRGDLQTHTTWSDGRTSIREMADAARALGHSFLAITDHTKGLAIAHGLDETRLRAQEDEVAAVNDALGGGFRVLRAAEMNLSPDGRGDMEPAALARLDVVLGAFHSALRRREDQTERYVAALHNRDVDVLAHPRGRIYDFRAGLVADWARVCGVAAETGTALEIDAHPDRQDLDVGRLAHARAAGTRISIGSDAHAPWELEAIDLGVAAALAAGIARERILNFMTADELCAWSARRRS